MKKRICLLLTGILLLALTACGQSNEPAAPAILLTTVQTTASTFADTETTVTETSAATEEPTAPEVSVTAETETGTETSVPTEASTVETATAVQTTAEISTTAEHTEPAITTADLTAAPTATAQTPAKEEPENPTEPGKTLTVYFSWSGTTEKIANTICEQIGGDLLRLEPETAYPTDYSQCAEVAKIERDENARPKIANLPESLDEYDTIFIGYPIWWHTAPMIIGSFLESYDLTGKVLYPFAQSASMDTEQFANSMAFVRESAKGAEVHDGLFVRASDAAAISAYLAESGFAA